MLNLPTLRVVAAVLLIDSDNPDTGDGLEALMQGTLRPRPYGPTTGSEGCQDRLSGCGMIISVQTASQPTRTSFVAAFVAMVRAIDAGTLIRRPSSKDKEFHFQNWVDARLTEAGLRHDSSGRNTYPDFTLIDYPEGYEVKGLAWPGREADYDSNSRVPSGEHNGRIVSYVFGRYPAKVQEDEYPVVDLVVCHGDFLNADHEYVHKNDSFRGFGSYGDILLRDRKMYVAPTPFALTQGTTGQHTLILPTGMVDDPALDVVGELIRVEAEMLVIGYEFDLQTNRLTPRLRANPRAGRRHTFTAYRLSGTGGGQVSLRSRAEVLKTLEQDTDA